MNPPQLSETNILLAVSDPAVAASARLVLERRGVRVTVAMDGAQALALFNPQFPVVIVSIALPGRDGLAVLREIKARAPNTQVILLTDASTNSAAIMGLKEGAYAYLLTPIADYLQLSHTVETALELYHWRHLAPKPTAPRTDPDLGSPTQLTDTLRHAESQSKILQGIMKSAAEIFDASKAVVLLMDSSQNLQLVASLGSLAKDSAAREFIRVVGEEFAWSIAKERRAATVTSPNKKFVHAGAPLITRDRLVGVLIVYDIPAGGANADRLGWLQAYAIQAAAAVELERLDEENARLSPTDLLTGAYKENVFHELAEREFRRSWRFNHSLSVIHIQIEGLTEIFKRSQELGDRALREISNICRQSVRNIDLVARGNDDSFTLLLLMTDSIGSQIVAERIVRAVRELPLSESKDALRITVKLGVTTYPHEGCTSLMDLLEIARSAHDRLREPGQNVITHA